MDPARRELYVEGRRDSSFLRWLVGESMSRDALLVEIDGVDIPNVAVGGNRARVLTFARMTAGEAVDISFFVDADQARLRPEDIPDNVWLTDGRDLERYVLRLDCLVKVWQLGLAATDVDVERILEQTEELCRETAALRLVSHDEDCRLAFQSTALGRYVQVDGEHMVTLDLDAYVQTLLQNSGISLRRREEIRAKAEVELEALRDIANEQLVHGKDAFAVIAEVLVGHGVSRDDAARLMWTSFERAMLADYPGLQQVVAYLQAA